MKKFVSGLAILLALSLMTCELTPLDGGAGYTNVVYSPDGKSVTLLLDGSVVPVDKSARALTKDLAIAGRDFYEVVFYYKPGASAAAQVARASWEIGEPASIRNVPRTNDPLGIDYGSTAATDGTIGDTDAPDPGNTPGTGYAILFVGRKSDKTLLGIGKLDSTTKIIKNDTTSVTFEIQAIEAGLRLPTGDIGIGESGDTFLTDVDDPKGNGDDTGVSAANTKLGVVRVSYGINTYRFPAYKIPVGTSEIIYNAKYNLGPAGLDNTYLDGVRVVRVDTIPAGQDMAKIMIPPRFPVGNSHRTIVAETAQETRAVVIVTADSAIPNSLPILIIAPDYSAKAKDGGLCALVLQIPVYAIHNTNSSPSTYILGVDKAIEWFIRPGFGTSVFDLDDGTKSKGGAILLAVGNVDFDSMGILTTD